MAERLQIAYSDRYLDWKLGKGDGSHPTNPIRAKLATERLTRRLGDAVEVIEPRIDAGDRERIESVHEELYVSRVLDFGISDDWRGVSFENGDTALAMFAGTARLTENILEGKTRVGFNPQGAKHHAAYDHSAGFCVFNDMAWAALEFQRAGLRPLYIDWDVNAGDGVQDLLQFTDIPTLSIHGSGLYPLTSDTFDIRTVRANNSFHSHRWHNEESSYFNWNIQPGHGDDAFRWAIDEVAEVVEDYRPDVILLAAGADAHEGEDWGMKFTYAGYDYASQRVAALANRFAGGRVLIGGAGGYQPYTHTPRVWANVVANIYRGVSAVVA